MGTKRPSTSRRANLLEDVIIIFIADCGHRVLVTASMRCSQVAALQKPPLAPGMASRVTPPPAMAIALVQDIRAAGLTAAFGHDEHEQAGTVDQTFVSRRSLPRNEPEGHRFPQKSVCPLTLIESKISLVRTIAAMSRIEPIFNLNPSRCRRSRRNANRYSCSPMYFESL